MISGLVVNTSPGVNVGSGNLGAFTGNEALHPITNSMNIAQERRVAIFPTAAAVWNDSEVKSLSQFMEASIQRLLN